MPPTRAHILLASKLYLAMTLDIGLPGQNGLAFARGLRRHEATRHLPIIVVSGLVEDAKLNASALGLIDWQTNPIDEKRQIKALRHVLLRSGAARKRTLHVEDDADVVHVMASLLGPGIEVVHAQNVAAAQRLFQAESFSLQILDVGLPDGSGARLLPLLCSIDKNFSVIIFSGKKF